MTNDHAVNVSKCTGKGMADGVFMSNFDTVFIHAVVHIAHLSEYNYVLCKPLRIISGSGMVFYLSDQEIMKMSQRFQNLLFILFPMSHGGQLWLSVWRGVLAWCALSKWGDGVAQLVEHQPKIQWIP